MSKYALKLEQLVQTDAYGDILVTIQYDGDGPKILSATGDQINPENKHSLDTVLGLVNFMLTKRIVPQEISEQLEAEPQDGIHLPLNDLLMVVATSLREAPASIDQIKPNILMEVVPEMIREFTENSVPAMEYEQPREVEMPQPEAPAPMPQAQPQDNNFGHFGNPQPQMPQPQESRQMPQQMPQQSQPQQNQNRDNRKPNKDQKQDKGSFFGGFGRGN
jgi:hypothetical protein